MKRLLAYWGFLFVLALAAVLLVLMSGCDNTYRTKWEGPINYEFLQKVQHDIEVAEASHAQTLYVTLESPGGGVLDTFDVLKTMRAAQKKGLIIEIHAQTLCASGCTFVLGAGTKGHRVASTKTIVLIHPAQVGGGFFSPPQCLDLDAASKKEDKIDKTIDTLILTWMADEYMLETGRSREEVNGWLTCGKEQPGDGTVLLNTGLADYLE